LMLWYSVPFLDRSDCKDIDGIVHNLKHWGCIHQWDTPPVPSSTPHRLVLEPMARLIVSCLPWMLMLSSPSFTWTRQFGVTMSWIFDLLDGLMTREISSLPTKVHFYLGHGDYGYAQA
jgi:hypothetical protein